MQPKRWLMMCLRPSLPAVEGPGFGVCTVGLYNLVAELLHFKLLGII